MAGVIGVYMMLDQFDRVLYVGASRNLDRRIREHTDKAWWPSAVVTETYPMDTWAQALSVERQLIEKLAPEGNTQSNDPDARLNSLIDGVMLRQTVSV